MAPSGAETGSILARIAETAPTISSSLSPRTASAVRKAAAWTGVTAPESRSSKAARA